MADLGATSVFPCPWTSDWTAIHGLPSLFVILEADCSMHVAWDPLPLLARTHHASRLLERRRLEADCNNRHADSPRGNGGRSARRRPDIYLDGRGTHSSILSSSFFLPEPSGARAPAPSSPLVSISLLRPPNLDSLHGNIPRHLLHFPKPLNRLLPGRNLSTTAGHHWGCLKLAPPSIRLSGRPPLEPTAGMDLW